MTDPADRLENIERMIKHYRLAKARRLERRRIIWWRKFKARQTIIELETPAERVH